MVKEVGYSKLPSCIDDSRIVTPDNQLLAVKVGIGQIRDCSVFYHGEERKLFEVGHRQCGGSSALGLQVFAKARRECA